MIDGVTGCSPRNAPQEVLADRKRPGQPAQLPFVAFLVGTQHKAALRRHLAGTFGLERKRLFPEVAGFADAVDDGAVSFIR
jgi:hypothetical protein